MINECADTKISVEQRYRRVSSLTPEELTHQFIRQDLHGHTNAPRLLSIRGITNSQVSCAGINGVILWCAGQKVGEANYEGLIRRVVQLSRACNVRDGVHGHMFLENGCLPSCRRTSETPLHQRSCFSSIPRALLPHTAGCCCNAFSETCL